MSHPDTEPDTEPGVSILLEGPEARHLAETLAREAGHAFGIPMEIRQAPTPSTEGTRTDPIAVAALVLSIPGAVLATLDIAERMALRDKLAPLLGRLKDAPPGTHARIAAPGLPTKDARAAHPSDLLDPAAAALRAGQLPTPLPPPEWDLFLAHASPDAARVDAVFERLSPGLRVFLDRKVVKPGEFWMQEIAEAQRRSRVTVVFVTGSLGTAWYANEEILRGVKLARSHPRQHRVVPVYLDGPPDDFMAVPYGLGVVQGIDGRGLDADGLARQLGQLVLTGGP